MLAAGATTVNKVDAPLLLKEFRQRNDLYLRQEISINGDPYQWKPAKEMEEGG